ncbi:MAG: 3'-5' exonuclease [Pseudoflavonifractor sp.]|nr:3'-5' exonuclease [Alloprevotella sp.]MCM1117048.1 3'-5' exonuclease [Pseudoflavonifractor sp.]
MDNFVAIDVETANQYPTSVCSIGAVKVVDGVIADTYYELVKPAPNYYIRRFTEEIHGISRKDTDGARSFPEVWETLERFIGTLPLVAHNKAFDERCIRACFSHHGMAYPEYPFYCTLIKARATIPRRLCGSFTLPSLAAFLGISFDNHHNALADAEACARIAQTIL